MIQTRDPDLQALHFLTLNIQLKYVVVVIRGLIGNLIVRRNGLLNLETYTLGVCLAVGCIVGFFYLLKFQDKWFDKMSRDYGNGGIRT